MKQKRYQLLGAILFIFVLFAPFSSNNIYAASRFSLANKNALTNVLFTNHNYTLRVHNQSVYFYSSHPRLVEINKKTGKLLVKEPGNVTIFARRRSTNQLVCKKTFCIKRRSDYLTSIKKTITLVTGQNKTLSVRKSPKNSTDVIYFRSSNPKVATVNSSTGKIHALHAGQTTITAYSMPNSQTSYNSSANRRLCIQVKVYSAIISAKQTTLSELEIGFQETPSTIRSTDFTVFNAYRSYVRVSSATKQGNKVILSLNRNLMDGKVYTIQYKDSRYNFTACDGIIHKFEFLNKQIPIQSETSIVACAYDKNGIQLGEYEYGNSYSGITFTVSSPYMQKNKKIKFTSPRGTALARIYYRMPGTNKIIADSGNVTISAFDPEMESAEYKCNITNSTDFIFKNDTVIHNTIPSNGTNYYAHIHITTSSNKEISDYSKYTLSSANTNILVLQNYTLSNSEKYVGLIPVKVGSTYIYLKDINGYTVASFPVTVNAPSVLTSVSLSKNAVPLVNTMSNGTETITITVKDQYGNSMNDSFSSESYLECISAPTYYVSVADVNNNPSIYYSYNFPEITFNNYDIAPGTYTYKVYVGEKYSTVTVIVTGLSPSQRP